MRRLIRKQNGMTAVGILIVLVVLAGVVTIVLRLFPLYNEKFQVVSALNTVVSQPDAASFTTKTAGKSFMTSMAITDVARFTDYNIKDHLAVIKPKKTGQPRILHLHYEARNKFFADIEFVLVFDKKIPLSGPGASE